MSAADVQYMIGGPDINKLEQYAKAVMEDLRNVPGAVDVDSSLSAGKPQFGIRVDRPKAAELGVSIADIANTLRLLVAGDKVSDYTDQGEQYEVHVRSFADARNRIDELKMVTVPSKQVRHGSPGATWCDSSRAPARPRSTAWAAPARSPISANLTPGTSEQGDLGRDCRRRPSD